MVVEFDPTAVRLVGELGAEASAGVVAVAVFEKAERFPIFHLPF